MTEIEGLFFELIQVSLGNRVSLSRNPSEKEWKAMFAMAQKHAVEGIASVALNELGEQGLRLPKRLLLEWIGTSEHIKYRNLIVNQRCKELETILGQGGFKCCVLKGQGTALYYKNNLYRQSGDIDVWVNGSRESILSFAKNQRIQVGHIDIKHSDMDFFEDIPVEIHYIPSWMFSPVRNKRLQRFFMKQADRQFENNDPEVGFTHTTIEFDLVFSLVHIYRHVFEEGVGLRQLLDYYHILLHSDKEQRTDALRVLKSLGMSLFVGGVMFVLQKCFHLESTFLLCEANERHGRFLLSEILVAGNFGHYDNRYQHKASERRFSNGLITLKRDIHYLDYYPSEVLWMPFWKLWHWCWRKIKGYL